ncbi:hypothetical protein CRENBAI_008108 [Crenichthys baileyi]|uniref:Uncharacterized protein n=1 Tax=Crenichthys baileyi TaxID=28760 RepID=A0AAV9RB87_9TELE
MPPGRLPREVFQARPTGRRPRGWPWAPLGGAGGGVWGEGRLAVSAESAAPATRSRIKRKTTSTTALIRSLHKLPGMLLEVSTCSRCIHQTDKPDLQKWCSPPPQRRQPAN